MPDTSTYNTTTIAAALKRYAAVTARQVDALLHRFGSLKKILDANQTELETMDILAEGQAGDIAQISEHLEDTDTYLRLLSERGITATSRFDDSYPPGLFELNDPPPLVFARGRLPDPKAKSVAIAGASEATNEGIELSVNTAQAFAEAGVQIISSLRKGIDASAHLGARSGKGVSFAFLESGLDEMPEEAAQPVAFEIIQEGGVISEHFPDEEIGASGYHMSNRLVVAAPQAVVITEFYKNSTRVLDLLECCSQIGKLAFVLIDPRHGALSDESSLELAIRCGAIPMVGLDKIGDITKSLV